jgi:transcriptional regulator with XRE-family HTH domain
VSSKEAYENERAALRRGLAANVRRLRAEREAGALSQSELFERANLHRTEVGRIEQAQTEPGLFTAMVLAEALGSSLDDLVAGLVVPKERKPPPGGRGRGG